MKTHVYKKSLAAIVVFLCAFTLLFAGDTALAQTAAQVQQGVNDVGGAGALSLQTVIKTAVNVLLYFIGSLSVIMIIYGGFKYVTSGGDSTAVASAKNTILYAVIGVIVSVLAFTIVNFAIGLFNKEPAAPTPAPVQQAPKGVGPLPG